MKTMLTLFFCFLAISLFAQTEKGASPLNPPRQSVGAIDNPQSTRAVVIGISDYQDAAIPDLRFADRDAEAFAQWLRSPAGGSLPDNQVKVLTNKNATTGKMIAALDGLIVASKPGDEAIIYFSGHGDVERVTKFQRGFLLTYDSPPAVYAAGAFSLQYLQDIVTTLSEAGVQAVVITDACRAGKLAGSEFGGSKATSAALAQQFANEVKILSCQPEEFSLEGEQWGGGRGCFSYHLVDALYGMADANADGTVNLLELGRYIEEKVPAEAAPHSQIPFTVGSKSAQIASVDTEALAQWRQQKNGEAMAFKKIDSRGLEDLALAKADTGILEMYHAFTAALDAGNLMATDSTVGKSADDYYKLLIQEPSIADLHGLMTRNFAAALMDEGQQLINLLLKNDGKTIDKFWRGKMNAGLITMQLLRASELLGEKHYVYKNLKAKEYYFRYLDLGKSIPEETPETEVSKIRKELIYKGLYFDPEAPYLIYLSAVSTTSDSIYLYIDRLSELAPNWVGWYRSMAQRVQWEKEDTYMAIKLYKKAIDVDSTFWSTLNWVADPLDAIGEHEEAKKYREKAVRTLYRLLEEDSTRKLPDELTVLGNALRRLRRYQEATIVLNEANMANNGFYYYSYRNLLPVLCDMGKFQAVKDTIASIKKLTGRTPFQSYLGLIYQYVDGDFIKAEKAFLSGNERIDKIECQQYLSLLYLKIGQFDKALALVDSIPYERTSAFFEKARLYFLLGNDQEGRRYCDSFLVNVRIKYIRKNFFDTDVFYVQKALVEYWIGHFEAMNKTIDEAKQALPGDPYLFFNLACFYAQTEELEKALQHLELSEKAGWEPYPFNWNFGTTKDIYLDPLRSFPAFQAWEQRWMPPYKDYSKE